MIRLFCSDFDGTLGRHGRISPKNVESIRRLQASGVAFALVTGRPLSNARQILSNHGLPGDIIASNGAVVARGEAVLSSRSIESEALEELVEFANAKHWFFIAYAQDRCLIPHWVPLRAEGRLAKKVQEKSSILPYRYEKGDAKHWQITKMNLYPHGSVKEEDRLRWEEDARLYVTTSSHNKFEVSAAGVSKWEGICVLASSQGWTPEEIATIGDYENDVSMLKGAGWSFAMGNAPEEVKKCAKVRVSSVKQDGASEAVEQVIRWNEEEKRSNGIR